MYVSRSPELQQSSRNWCRTPARPATGTSVALSYHPPPVGCRATKPHVPAPVARTASMRPGGGKEVSRRARIRTPIPPPSFMQALRTSWPGGWEFGDRKLPGGRETGGHRRVRGRAGACADGLAEWLLFVGGSWGIYYAGASPLHAPSKEPTCR